MKTFLVVVLLQSFASAQATNLDLPTPASGKVNQTLTCAVFTNVIAPDSPNHCDSGVRPLLAPANCFEALPTYFASLLAISDTEAESQESAFKRFVFGWGFLLICWLLAGKGLYAIADFCETSGRKDSENSDNYRRNVIRYYLPFFGFLLLPLLGLTALGAFFANKLILLLGFIPPILVLFLPRSYDWPGQSGNYSTGEFTVQGTGEKITLPHVAGLGGPRILSPREQEARDKASAISVSAFERTLERDYQEDLKKEKKEKLSKPFLLRWATIGNLFRIFGGTVMYILSMLTYAYYYEVLSGSNVSWVGWSVIVVLSTAVNYAWWWFVSGVSSLEGVRSYP